MQQDIFAGSNPFRTYYREAGALSVLTLAMLTALPALAQSSAAALAVSAISASDAEAGAAAVAAADSAEGGAASIAAADGSLEVIARVTVSTRRRNETSQSVPTSMSVLDSKNLEDSRIYRVQDLQQLLPSTTVNYVHARQLSFAVRGLGNNTASDGL